MKYKRCLLFAFAATVASAPLAAEVMPIPGSEKIKPVFDNSSVVCFCRIRSITVTAQRVGNLPDGGELDRQTIQISAEVLHAFKNDERHNQDALEVWLEQDVPERVARDTIFDSGQTFLFFLTRSSGSDYALTDRFIGASLLDTSPSTPLGSGLQGLEIALAAIAAQSQKPEAIRLLQLLAGFEGISPETGATLRKLSRREDPEIALWAIAALLDPNSSASLQELSRYLTADNGKSGSWALMIIQGKLAKYRSPSALPLMEELTGSKYSAIRLGAMRYLRQVKSRQAAKTLVDRLDDPESEIQYLALITLAETFGKYEGDFAPSMYLFDKKPEYYTTIWKKWWREQGAALVRPKRSE